MAVDTNFCAQQLGGIFISYVAFSQEQPFNELTEKENSNKACKICAYNDLKQHFKGLND